MSLRIPFFGLIASRSPMQRLHDHYDTIAKGVELIEESLECYIGGGGACAEFKELSAKVDMLEDMADKIKRNIRNHLPRALFMPVDKTLFFNYTRQQDNILDEGQDAMNWLLMRPVDIPEEFIKDILDLVGEVSETVSKLGPALDTAVALVHGRHYDRPGTKETIREVRRHHSKKVRPIYLKVISEVYESDRDFKDIHQIIHFAEALHSMSHNTSGCADLLRAMIVR